MLARAQSDLEAQNHELRISREAFSQSLAEARAAREENCNLRWKVENQRNEYESLRRELESMRSEFATK